MTPDENTPQRAALDESSAEIIALRRELAAKEEALGSNTDVPNPNGSVYALKNWWKLKCDERDEEISSLRAANEGLRAVLERVLSTAVPNKRDNPLMFAAWVDARSLLAGTPSPWRGIDSAPRDEECFFLLRGKQVGDPNVFANTSGEPILGNPKMRVELTKYGRWSALCHPLGWFPKIHPDIPQPPTDGREGA